MLMSRFFDPVVEKFIDAIRRALPGCDDRDLYWAYHFLSGALTLTSALVLISALMLTSWAIAMVGRARAATRARIETDFM